MLRYWLRRGVGPAHRNGQYEKGVFCEQLYAKEGWSQSDIRGSERLVVNVSVEDATKSRRYASRTRINWLSHVFIRKFISTTGYICAKHLNTVRATMKVERMKYNGVYTVRV